MMDDVLVGFVEFGDDVGEEHRLPLYSDVGCIKFKANDISEALDGSDFEYEVLDSDGCTFWIEEGMGIDYWLEQYIPIKESGSYVVQGITGTITTDYYGECDEEWEYDSVDKLPVENKGEAT